MRQLAVIHPNFNSCDKCQKFTSNLFGKEVHFVLGDFGENSHYHLKKHEVLIRKKGFSLNYRDLNFIMKARTYFDESNNTKAYFPIGSEFVGEVIQLGNTSHNFKVGDLVIPDWNYDGGFEKNKVKQGISSNCTSKELEVFHIKKLIKIPPDFPLDVAAGFSIGAQTSLSILRRAGITPRTRILLTSGSSSTSYFIIKMLSAFKFLTLCVLTSSDEKAQQIKDIGQKNLEVYVLKNPADFSGLQHLNSSIDVVIDPFSTVYLSCLYKVLAFNGRYITCGIENTTLYSEKVSHSPTIDLPEELFIHFIMNNIQFLGNCLGTSKDLLTAINFCYKKGIDFKPFKTVSYENPKAFIDASFNDQKRFGKTVCMYE